MNPLLKRAEKLLHISEVLVRESSVKLSDDIVFIKFGDMPKAQQAYQTMVKIEELTMSKDGAEEIRFLYMFRYATGIRLIQFKDKDAHVDKVEPLFEIEADFEACYLSEKEVTREELEAFSQIHIGPTVWPYWREFVQSSCSRMGIDTIRVPPFESKPKKNNLVLDKITQ